MIFPRTSLLWEFGPARVQKVARFFAGKPNLMRLLGASELPSASGWRSASTTDDSPAGEPAVVVARR